VQGKGRQGEGQLLGKWRRRKWEGKVREDKGPRKDIVRRNGRGKGNLRKRGNLMGR
jgi:hypothetical protein